jgi:hypothetical protein
VSIDLLEPAAAALGELRDRVVFLGGATIALWLTDPAARAPRITYDVDVVAVEVTTLGAYDAFQHELRRLHFSEDMHSGVIGRWRHLERGIVLDAVPARSELAGFSGQWLAAAVRDPAEETLPSGTSIRAVRPPWLIVTKLEAFRDRGQSDCLHSRDFEDIVTLVDGREQLIDELRGLPADAQRYIGQEMAAILQLPSFAYGVEGTLPAGEATRADAVTVPRLATIAAL